MRLLFLFTLCMLALTAPAQKLQLKSYNVGFRPYEINVAGGDPRYLGPMFQDPKSYEELVRTFAYNSIWGGGGIQWMNTVYLNTEWHKPGASSRFWKRNTLQAGLLAVTRMSSDAGSIGEEGVRYSPDTAFIRNMFSVRRQQQFLGANVGFNRRFCISKGIDFVAGLHLQGSVAVVHHYHLQLDSTTNRMQGAWQTTTTLLPDRQGKHFFQWQAGVPLGLEINVYKKQLLVRPELVLGIVGGKFRPRLPSIDECNGFGLWVIYAPKRGGRPSPAPSLSHP